MIEGVDWANRFSYNWSLAAPVQYETDESGVVPGEIWHDGSGEYSPAIHTKVYQLRTPSLINHLLADLIKRFNYEYSTEDFIETKHPDFDRLIIHEDDEQKEVFAAKGKAVMYVRYHGYSDIKTVIENTAEKIQMISGEY